MVYGYSYEKSKSISSKSISFNFDPKLVKKGIPRDPGPEDTPMSDRDKRSFILSKDFIDKINKIDTSIVGFNFLQFFVVSGKT